MSSNFGSNRIMHTCIEVGVIRALRLQLGLHNALERVTDQLIYQRLHLLGESPRVHISSHHPVRVHDLPPLLHLRLAPHNPATFWSEAHVVAHDLEVFELFWDVFGTNLTAAPVDLASARVPHIQPINAPPAGHSP